MTRNYGEHSLFDSLQSFLYCVLCSESLQTHYLKPSLNALSTEAGDDTTPFFHWMAHLPVV